MEIIGIVATVLLGIYLCFSGVAVVFLSAAFGSENDKLIGCALFLIGASIVTWTLYTNVSVQVK